MELAEMMPADDDLRRCHARSSRTGGRCLKWAIRGGTVCSTHGGRAAQVRAAAARRVQADEMAGRMMREAIPAEGAQPAAVLLGLLRESAGRVVWLGERLRDCADVEELLASPALGLYDAERSTLVRVAALALRFDLVDAPGDADNEELLIEALRRTVKESGLGAVRDIDAMFRRHVAEVEGAQ